MGSEFGVLTDYQIDGGRHRRVNFLDCPQRMRTMQSIQRLRTPRLSENRSLAQA
jgi:hypothetical protein